MKNTLKSKTFSKAAKAEIAILYPTVTAFTKRHVAGISYVYYIKNEAGETLTRVYRENGEMICHDK